jgi:hypothetical protein
MEQFPWLQADFDLRKVLVSDDSGNFKHSLEDALEDLSRRLDVARMACRDRAEATRIDALLRACDTSRDVLTAAHSAVHGA